MAENQEEKKDVVDPELENARKSMGDRVDPDTIPPKTEDDKKSDDDGDKKEVITPGEKKPDDAGDKKPDEGDKKPDVSADDTANKKPNRPEAYIPMPKYLAEKEEHKKELAEANRKAAEAEAKINELQNIAGQKAGDKKDEDIEAFMQKTGFDRETVEGLLELASKRLLTPEMKKAIETAENVVKEAEIEAQYEKEFEKFGLPALQQRYPKATDEQIEMAKEFLDQAAHTNEFHDKPLDYIIYKHQSKIDEMFGGSVEDKKDEKGQTKKTLEPTRPGAGKISTLSAKDFETTSDFSALNDMEQSERAELIKSFPTKTYENFKQWVSSQNNGLEVMRNGQRITLK